MKFPTRGNFFRLIIDCNKSRSFDKTLSDINKVQDDAYSDKWEREVLISISPYINTSFMVVVNSFF
jgi:hypothetical protein